MAVENSTDQLVERIRRDAKVPKGSTYYDAATLLGMADTETRSLVVQQVAASSGEYLVTYVDVPLVPGKRAYRLPSRAIREKEVERYDADGNPLPFALVDSAQAKDNRGSGRHYYFEGGSFVPVLESGATGGFFRVRYYRWPSRLVTVAECAVVVGLPGGGVASVLTASDPGFSPTLDIVKGTPTYETIADGIDVADAETVSPVNNYTLPDLPETVELGDYLCPEGATCFPQLPLVFHDALVELVASRVRREMNDAEGSAMAKASAEEKLGKAVAVSSPRSKQGTTVCGSPWMR